MINRELLVERRYARPIRSTQLTGRLRVAPKAPQPVNPPQYRADITPMNKPLPTRPLVAAPTVDGIKIVKPQPYSQPARPKQQPSRVLHRQSVPAPTAPLPPALPPRRPETAKTAEAEIKKPKRAKRQVVMIIMASAVFIIGLIINVQTIHTNHLAKTQVAALAKKAAANSDDSGATPSEAKPSGGAYSVAPNAPKSIKIPKIGVDSRIVSLGVTKANQLKAPTNIYDVGWYDASAHPGDEAGKGAMLLDGHVHGPTLPGVFVDLKKLAADDTIQITRGDNQVFTYKVVRIENYDVDSLDMGWLLASIQPGQPGLNLITCGGPYDRQSGEYTQRTAVFAIQVSS